jgi:hypothetical protein
VRELFKHFSQRFARLAPGDDLLLDEPNRVAGAEPSLSIV